MPTPVVSELAESELLARILPWLPGGPAVLLGPGDDAAVLAAPDGRVVVTTDVLVEDHHFRRAWSDAEQVGRRAVAQNLADVAAMGAVPTGLVVGLVMPPDLPVAWLEGLARGLGEAAGAHGVAVVGGDLSAGPAVVVAVTAHGDLGGRDPVLRGGARPGDVVAHAGRCGVSAAGLALLAAGRADLDPELVAAHRVPEPPLAAGPAAARAGATAMLDVSDGLLRDAGRLAQASGVVVDLDEPGRGSGLDPDLARLHAAADALGADPSEWLLAGGEDHGLLATFPAGTALPAPFRAIGRVRGVAGNAGEVWVAERPPRGSLGWDHFGARGRTGASAGRDRPTG